MSKWIFFVIVGLGWILGLGSSGFAGSWSIPTLPIVIDPVIHDVSTVGQVKGIAKFERRATIVPFDDSRGAKVDTLCQDGVCSKSETYWVLVVVQDKVKYELEEMFSLRSETAPESMLVAGSTIRPGTHIMLEGRIEQIAPDYATIRDIRRINIEMD